MTGTNLKPRKGYISRRLFNTVTAYLDLKGYLTKVVKTKRANNYFVYLNGEIYGKARKTRESAKRTIYHIFKRVVNDQLPTQRSATASKRSIT